MSCTIEPLYFQHWIIAFPTLDPCIYMIEIEKGYSALLQGGVHETAQV